jgi:hypothetical protein
MYATVHDPGSGFTVLCWQDYVAACVETQQQQEKELGKLKAEKREVERVSHRPGNNSCWMILAEFAAVTGIRASGSHRQ